MSNWYMSWLHGALAYTLVAASNAVEAAGAAGVVQQQQQPHSQPQPQPIQRMQMMRNMRLFLSYPTLLLLRQ